MKKKLIDIHMCDIKKKKESRRISQKDHIISIFIYVMCKERRICKTEGLPNQKRKEKEKKDNLKYRKNR